MPSPLAPEAALVVEDVCLSTGPYRLEAALAYSEAGAAKGAVVLAGPHPCLGGNLDNNVVRGLANGLAERQWVTLRFNYRGVGRSHGPVVDVARHLALFWQTSHVPHEMDLGEDVQAAVDFIREIDGKLPLALIGYSFGCALLPPVHPNTKPLGIVLIAPTVTKHAYDSYPSINTPLLVIASEDDFATPAADLDAWFDSLSMPRRLVRERFDNHFFRGHEAWLVETVCDFLNSPLQTWVGAASRAAPVRLGSPDLPGFATALMEQGGQG
jgi:alpha/beta superfamily hydrolase